jgi:hypothetical protein
LKWRSDCRHSATALLRSRFALRLSFRSLEPELDGGYE